jgi:hypothetical protein
MSQPGVQGVGISSSLDAPGEAALMIFLLRGAAHNPIPPVIDGLRTRVRESSQFRAGTRDANTHGPCQMQPRQSGDWHSRATQQKVPPPFSTAKN